MSSDNRGILSRYDLNKKSNLFVYILMLIVITTMVVTMVYPILVTVFNALKTNKEVNTFPPKFFPTEWHWESFAEAWNYIDLTLYFKNTLIIFVGNMAVIFFVLGLAAYALSRLVVPKKKLVTMLLLLTLFIPPTTYIVPNFLNLKDLGMIDSFAAFWLPAGANAFFLLLLKSFFDTIHHELFEAARMDGASELRLYFRIVVPLSIPIFATLAIFVFASAWNDWFWPSLILHNSEKYPLATAIYKYVIDARRLDLNVKFALLSMVSVPPIIVFLIFQRFIVRGLHLSGIKG